VVWGKVRVGDMGWDGGGKGEWERGGGGWKKGGNGKGGRGRSVE